MNNGNSKVKRTDKLAIKRNREGKSYVHGLTEIPIDTKDSMTGLAQLEALTGIRERRWWDAGTTNATGALEAAHREGRIPPGGRVLLTAFGTGYAWGSVLLRFPA